MTVRSDVSHAIPTNGIREIVDLAVAQPPGTLARLDIGEPGVDTPASVVAAARRAAEAGTGYTQSVGTAELRARLAQRLETDYGFGYSAEDIVVTQGAVQGLHMLLTLVLAGVGGQVLIPDPAWPNYEMQTILAGGEPVRYDLPPEAGFVPDPQQIRSLINARTKAIIINSPSNPTGAVIPADVLEEIVQIAADNDILLISDEVYDEITFDVSHVPAPRFGGAGVAAVYSFSKTYAMTGMRVGYVALPRQLRTAAMRVQETTISCISAVSQAAAVAALDVPKEDLLENALTYRRRRDLAIDILKDGGLSVHRPDGAFYLLVPIPHGRESRQTALDLLHTGVSVAPGSAFGNNLRQFVRISLAASEDTLRLGLDRFLTWRGSASSNAA